MLVLTRKEQETVKIGDAIEVRVVRIRGSQVKLGFTAPRDLKIDRGESPRPPEGEGKG